MPSFLVKLIDKLGTARWLAIPAEAFVSFLSAFFFWFLFALKDYSSNVRDNFEQPPGLIQYAIFALVCLALLVSFWLGICSIVLGLRRRPPDQA